MGEAGKLAIRGGTPVRGRPFHRWPVRDDHDLARLRQVLESGTWSMDGPMERSFEQAFARRHDAVDAVAVTNGTSTLLLCLRAIGIRPGDEVIVPALTWTATATAVLEANAVPVFVDIDPGSFCIAPAAIEAAITPRTVAIIPVHLYCSMADMDRAMAIAERHHLAVIEDCAHAHGARWSGRSAGSIGRLGSFSFQMSKVMTAGEGGAVTSRDGALIDKVYSLKNCGRIRHGRGTRILGGNHRMTEWQAAILLGQLERLDEHMARRYSAIERLRSLCAAIPGVSILAPQPRVEQAPVYRLAFHYDKAEASGIPRQLFIDAVRAEGVPIEAPYSVVYRNPLYPTSEMTWYPGQPVTSRCSVAEHVAEDASFTLPHEILLGDDADLHDVAEAIDKVVSRPAEAAGLGSRLREHARGLLRRTR